MSDKITAQQAINHGAELATVLRQECEKQYERAQSAEAMVDALQAELSALRNSVRQKSVLTTEQQLREVTAERDRLRERLGAMEVAAKTVGYCYRNNPANFAVALNALEDMALSVREAIGEAMTQRGEGCETQ